MYVISFSSYQNKNPLRQLLTPFYKQENFLKFPQLVHAGLTLKSLLIPLSLQPLTVYPSRSLTACLLGL